MYNVISFASVLDMVDWLNENKSVEPKLLTEDYHLIYWEEEPQPQQKDLIPESDKPQSL